MNTSTVINVRIDKETKAKAQKVITNLGLDISSAIKAFLYKVVQTKSIPFVLEESGVMNDPKYIKQIKKETEWAIKYGKRYSSSEEMVRDILGE
jgi:addiction module RelB/DinJ family antitoxin